MSFDEIERELSDVYEAIEKIRIRVLRLQVKISQNRLRNNWREKSIVSN